VNLSRSCGTFSGHPTALERAVFLLWLVQITAPLCLAVVQHLDMVPMFLAALLVAIAFAGIVFLSWFMLHVDGL
jgi:hypothetical protein